MLDSPINVSDPSPRSMEEALHVFAFVLRNCDTNFESSQVYYCIHKQQTTIRKPIECAPEASNGGREWAEMTGGFHLEVTRHKVLTCVDLT